MKIKTMGMGAAAWLLTIGMAAAAPAPDSKRMGRAKDFIADEQWSRAIVELQAAAADPKEANRDEALFWLAHSQHQAGDDDSALQTIATLERTAPKSTWVKPAGSLRVEIAQRLRRDDVLWMMVAPPAPAAPVHPGVPFGRPGATPRPAGLMPTTPTPPSMTAPPAIPALPPAAVPTPTAAPPSAPPAPPPPAMTPTTPAPAVRVRPARPAPPAPPPPPMATTWTTEYWLPSPGAAPDTTVKLQALAVLLDAHSAQVIPLLREIALDRNNPDDGRQAVIVLAQSRRPEAERIIVEAARQGPEPVRIVAVRELGRFDGPTIPSELMRVYTMTGTSTRLRRQVVSSLGERADNASLLRIVKSEPEPAVRDLAITTLGRTGARDQLRLLYSQTPRISPPALLLSALLTAKDDDELIRIARTEQDPALRARARQLLRLLATPKAVKFLDENP